jgi:hypothetical protein
MWIGVDLDGTLARNPSMRDLENGITIGPPVPVMAARVRVWLAEGKTVKIFTARACDPNEIPAIQKWLSDNEFPNLEITNCKDFDLVEFWDDRAIRVERNTGKIV